MPKVTANTNYDAAEGQMRKKRKRRAATNALREIKREQKKTKHIIPTAPFNRLVAGIASEYHSNLRFKGTAYNAFHTAAEDFIIKLFSDANGLAIHSKRETLQPRDLKLAYKMQQDEN